ncbi:glycerophosphodiester phosphodiesterase family protein [Pseudovibrio exalbescens]|uniref:glycerophosphodiester phosphodiesterase family protein n=1 Tax=Pseudovibrio exalbescens TaxID=197461 RepID=UPI0023666DE6|nr:glycerophosphodiester phosphodiesterase family protein [Pseudovibrio exalbescens]MDD7909836.1 glycerophosphodiester phosphodiesterase family protein [Pseudovibrio exalbescens]
MTNVDQTKIYAHRGAPCLLPENTLEGFAYSLELGVDGIELDVLLTKDNVPVVTHNHTLLPDTTRDANGKWLSEEGPLVRDLTLAELRQFDMGAIRPDTKYAAKFPNQKQLSGVPVPTLDEFLALVRDSGKPVELLVELKHRPEDDAITNPAEFADLVGRAIKAKGLEKQSFMHSFHWGLLDAAHKAHPEIRCSYLTALPKNGDAGTLYEGSPWLPPIGFDGRTTNLLQQLKAVGAAVWSPYHANLTTEARLAAQALGLEVITWTATTPEDISRDLQSGVDGMITDDPATALALRERLKNLES